MFEKAYKWFLTPDLSSHSIATLSRTVKDEMEPEWLSRHFEMLTLSCNIINAHDYLPFLLGFKIVTLKIL